MDRYNLYGTADDGHTVVLESLPAKSQSAAYEIAEAMCPDVWFILCEVIND